MDLKTQYIAIAIFSIILALILLLLLFPRLQSGMAVDLAFLTLLTLMLNFVISLFLLFIEEKLGLEGKAK